MDSDIFNQHSTEYNDHMQRTGHYNAQNEILKLIMQFIKSPILDLACGPGHLLKELSKTFSELKGNDLSENMIQLAKQNNPQLTFTNDDATELISYHQKFKTIFCVNTLFYLDNKEKAIERWKDLLEEKGKLIIIEEYPFVYPNNKFLEGLKLNPLSPEQIIKLMSNLKLKLIYQNNIKIDDKHKLFVFVFESLLHPINFIST